MSAAAAKSTLEMFSMKGKVTVVTGKLFMSFLARTLFTKASAGGARGIGFALAEAAAGCGSDIALLDLSDHPPANLETAKKDTDTVWRYYTTNVTDPESLKGAMKAIVSDFGRIDNWHVLRLLVNSLACG